MNIWTPLGEGESQTDVESSTDKYIVLCIKQIAGERLLFNTGSPAWCSAMTERVDEGREGRSRGR